MDSKLRVNGLALPVLLTELIKARRWRHPGDEAMRELMPWFESPLDFLTSFESMRSESRSLNMYADDPRSSELFRVIRGSGFATPTDLPWLDAEQAVLIAVNRIHGDDVAVALDYRTHPADPRVVASDFWTDPQQCSWRFVTPTLSQLVHQLQLD
jgi:hypothetical protein